MAFELRRFVTVNVGYNAGQITTSINPSSTPVLSNGPAVFTYASSADTIAQIGAANYFAEVVYDIAVNDWIFATGNDASAFYQVLTVDRDAGTVTVGSAFPSGVIGTANIQDGAVTNAKMAVNSVDEANIVDGAVTSEKLAASILQYVAVEVTAANILAMYATPLSILAAGGANTVHLVEHACLMMTYDSAQYAAGGVIGLQYGNTANLAGEAASSTIAAANIQGAASTMDMVEGLLSSGAFTAVANQALYLSNASAAFTTGDSDFVLHLWYRTVPTVGA